jgi:hypothetical protein
MPAAGASLHSSNRIAFTCPSSARIVSLRSYAALSNLDRNWQSVARNCKDRDADSPTNLDGKVKRRQPLA